MNQKDYELVYVDPYSLLVATRERKIIRIYCPFTVRVIQSVGELLVNQVVPVDMVKSDPNGWLIYIIQGKAYWYGGFQIVLE